MESWEMDCDTLDSSMDQSIKGVQSCNDSIKDGINRLPNEVLIMIFAGLPLEDCKNTRLVSKRWNELNNIAQISRREKFICRGIYDLVSVLQIVHNSAKAVLNLEFIHFDFAKYKDRFIEFWTENGKRIESLSFTHCQLSEETVQHIVINCDKMKYLAIHNPSFDNPLCKGGRKLMSGPALEKMINLRRVDLHSLILEAEDDRWMSNNFLRVMFDIYPNIDNFSFMCPGLDGDEYFTMAGMTDEELLRSDEELSFHNIHKKLVESRKIMKSMNFDAVQIEDHSNVLLHNFPKLTSLGRTYLQPVPEHPIFDFLSRHHLRSIEFHVPVSRSEAANCPFLEHLMNSLLDSSTLLESLKIEVSKYVFLLDESIFTKIKNSKLKFLQLNFLLKAVHSGENDHTINETLKCLHLTRPRFRFRLDRGMVNAFVRTFRGLSELVIDRFGVNDDVLQDIFLYQRQLTSLKLRSLGSVHRRNLVVGLSDYGFTGVESNGERTGYSIRDLQNLECLEINRYDERETKRFFDDLRLPNLKSLFLNVHIPEELFRETEFFTHLKDLETLVFRRVEHLHSLSWLKICQHLKKLKFLCLETMNPLPHNFMLSKPEYEDFFEKCPSLRVFRWRVNFLENGHCREGTTYSYFLDTFTKSLKMVTNPGERLLPPDSIDPYWSKTF